MFSPYYAWSGWRDPLDHCAVNVALYRLDGGANLWAMTERGRRALAREHDALAIGRSALRWDGRALRIDIDEYTAPIPQRLRGSITLEPDVQTDWSLDLDSRRRHVWRPLAPRARMEADFAQPGLRWRGAGYWDSNAGAEPLQDGFARWEWARCHRARDVVLCYDTTAPDGASTSRAFLVHADGQVAPFDSSARAPLPATPIWRVPRSSMGEAPRVRATLEDTPFYARSVLRTHIDGESLDAMHESLSLTRLRQPVVRAMLPFRMPRIVG